MTGIWKKRHRKTGEDKRKVAAGSREWPHRERKKNQTAIDALKQEYEENHEIYAEEIVRHMIEV